LVWPHLGLNPTIYHTRGKYVNHYTTDKVSLQSKIGSICWRFLHSLITQRSFFFVGRHDAIFVVGSLDETVMLRGMRYHPIDIETSVQRSHRKICEWYVRYIILIHTVNNKYFFIYVVFIVLFHWNNNLWVDVSFHSGHIILIQNQPVFALTL
jgi:hypothetical protein